MARVHYIYGSGEYGSPYNTGPYLAQCYLDAVIAFEGG